MSGGKAARQPSFLRPTDSSLRHRTPALWANLNVKHKQLQATTEGGDNPVPGALEGSSKGLLAMLQKQEKASFEIPIESGSYAQAVLEESTRLAKLFEYACHMSPMSRSLDNVKFVKCMRFCGLIRKGCFRTIDIDLVFARAKSRGRNTLSFSGFGRAMHMLAQKKYGHEMASEQALTTLLEKDVHFNLSGLDDELSGSDADDEYSEELITSPKAPRPYGMISRANRLP